MGLFLHLQHQQHRFLMIPLQGVEGISCIYQTTPFLISFLFLVFAAVSVDGLVLSCGLRLFLIIIVRGKDGEYSSGLCRESLVLTALFFDNNSLPTRHSLSRGNWRRSRSKTDQFLNGFEWGLETPFDTMRREDTGGGRSSSCEQSLLSKDWKQQLMIVP